MTDSEKTTATIEGPAWSAGASGWVEHWAQFAAPAREAVARAAGIEAGASVLDVGCGSGEFCELAAARGAQVSGIDAAARLVEVARRRLPEADLRVGPIERLPWRDESFDLVTGFNAFQFAADFVAALTEAGRVTRRGGRVAICNWGRIEDRQVHAISAPLREVEPPSPPGVPPYGPPPIGEPGVLEDLARRAALAPDRADEVEVPYEFPDRPTLERALLAFAPILRIGPDVAERVVRTTVETDAEPFRRSDGSYRFENRFRYLIAVVP
jgi:SAM-dependent methyltransferase